MTHATEVPYGWYERKGSNPWFDRETGKVVLPTTIKHAKNYVLTREELVEYEATLIEMRDAIQKELGKTARTVKALEKGAEPTYAYRDNCPAPRTLCHVLELKVVTGKVELKLMKFLLAATQRAKGNTVVPAPAPDEFDVGLSQDMMPGPK